MNVVDVVAVAIGCGAGSCARFAVSLLRRPWHMPWPTIAANAAGSALLGGLLASFDGGRLSALALLALGAGFAGGLTTFSTMAVDAVTLWREGRRSASLAYLSWTALSGLAGSAAGWWIVTQGGGS